MLGCFPFAGSASETQSPRRPVSARRSFSLLLLAIARCARRQLASVLLLLQSATAECRAIVGGMLRLLTRVSSRSVGSGRPVATTTSETGWRRLFPVEGIPNLFPSRLARGLTKRRQRPEDSVVCLRLRLGTAGVLDGYGTIGATGDDRSCCRKPERVTFCVVHLSRLPCARDNRLGFRRVSALAGRFASSLRRRCRYRSRWGAVCVEVVLDLLAKR